MTTTTVSVEQVSDLVTKKVVISDEIETCSDVGSVSEDEEELEDGENNEQVSKNKESDEAEYFDAPDKLGFENNVRRDSGFMEDKKTKSEDEEDDDEEDEEDFVAPDEELVKKIVEQVEFYFSDDSITRDAFLLKHVRRNKEGYVSLKLISCFKRVKHLTKDWRQVTYALKKASSKLQVNETDTKVRRLEPLPPCDETTPSRSIIAYNLPIDKPNVENVAELFSKYGDIALIRILRQNNSVPGDIKQFIGKHPEIGSSVCALVEFEKTEFAKQAVTSGEADGLKVLQLTVKPKKEKTKSRSNDRRISTESQLSGSERDELDSLRRRYNARRRGSRVEMLRGDAPPWIDSSTASSEADSPGIAPFYPRRMSYQSSPGSSGSMSSCCSSPGYHPRDNCYCNSRRNPLFDYANYAAPAVANMVSPQAGPPPAAIHYYNNNRNNYVSEADRTGNWRRPSQQQMYMPPPQVPIQQAPQVMMHSTHMPIGRRHSDAATGLTVPDNVLRLPRGPSTTGSRGFNAYRGHHHQQQQQQHIQSQPQWTQHQQPNWYQQNRGRSGSVPTVVYTQYPTYDPTYYQTAHHQVEMINVNNPEMMVNQFSEPTVPEVPEPTNEEPQTAV